jgi:hypothetical protein
MEVFGDMRDDFALLILSHGRANNVKTLETIKGCGYTGKWYIIIDNEDNQADDYYRIYGKEHIIMFDKYKKSLEVDTCDIPRKRNAVIYARESCFEIARSLGLKYFLELDDDYTEFRMRYDKCGSLSSIYVQDMDSIIDEVLDFLDTSGAYCVAFSQTGDFIGGLGSKVYKERLTRKMMNAFFCRVDREFNFIGRMNDDVNTYVLDGMRGKLFFTIADIALNQPDTQQNTGGLTEMYSENGTYVKSFFSVMVAPSCVKISEMGCNHRRIHHLVDWEHCTPKIISDRFKK